MPFCHPGTDTDAAAPLVVGTIAYWRGLKIPESSGWAAELQDPANVKKLVQYMHRKLAYTDLPIPYDPSIPPRRGSHLGRVPFLWTGRVKGGDCLVDPTLAGCPADMAGRSISNLQPRGADCASSGRAGKSRRRQAGGSCPLVLNPGSGGGGSITYASGTPSPTCVSGCGTLCSGFYCLPNPTGTPPDYWDPEDPSHKTTTAPSTTTTTTSSTPKPSGRPLTRDPINCFKESDFPGHGDLQSGDQDQFSVDFSSLRSQMGNDDSIGPGDAPIRYRRTDKHGINYDYRVEWVAGCVTTVARQSFGFPLGMSQSLITAYLLVREDFTKCKCLSFPLGCLENRNRC